MTEQSVLIVVEFDGEIDPALSAQVSAETGSEVRAVKKHGLSGDVTNWLLIGNFIVTALATLAPIISSYVKDRRVKSIKVGDLTIENPKPDEIASILQAWAKSQSGPV
jgi:hypothetical protein